MAKEILCGFGVDVDAVAGWLGSYGGEDSPDDISRGLFAGEVGSPRLLKLFGRLGIKTTWFIPGHSIETFPAEMKAVAEAGHEIGIHGYSHENPIAMTREQEIAVLDKCIELVTTLAGRRPTGYVAPWWEFSTVTNELLLERGIKYDHSLMHHDHQPYYVRVGDSWTKIDYSKQPAEWMVPLRRGRETDLIEIPASWYLDDLPPMLFIKKSPNSHGFVTPRDIEQITTAALRRDDHRFVSGGGSSRIVLRCFGSVLQLDCCMDCPSGTTVWSTGDNSMTRFRDVYSAPVRSLPRTHGLSANSWRRQLFRARTEECGRLTLFCLMPSYCRAGRFGIHSAAAALERLTPVKPARIFSRETVSHRIRKRYLRLGHLLGLNSVPQRSQILKGKIARCSSASPTDVFCYGSCSSSSSSRSDGAAPRPPPRLRRRSSNSMPGLCRS
jgi:peptidoglycan-N-acetylglucosamine deacetylase